MDVKPLTAEQASSSMETLRIGNKALLMKAINFIYEKVLRPIAEGDHVVIPATELAELRAKASSTNVLYASHTVYSALRSTAKQRTSAENVSDVLDALHDLLKVKP